MNSIDSGMINPIFMDNSLVWVSIHYYFLINGPTILSMKIKEVNELRKAIKD